MTTKPQKFMSVNRKKLKRSSVSPSITQPLKLWMGSQSEDVRIEIVPLIDVIFCILTFFILAAVGFSRQQAISVDLPKASTGTPQGRQILVVSLDELGQVYIEKEPVVTKDEFIQKLTTYRQQNPLGLMALYASPQVSYNDVVQVLDLLREVGGDRVALATVPGSSQSGSDPSKLTPPPATGVPGFTPYQDPNFPNPNGSLNPYSQPQLGTPTQPQIPLPGSSQTPLQPSPGLSPGNPGRLPVPSPNTGTGLTPKTNSAPAAPNQPGSQRE